MLDGIHSLLEMAIASLFDRSYCFGKRALLITNGHVEYTYTKKGIGYEMTARTCSLNKPDPLYKVTFADKPFPISTKFIDDKGLHNLLDISSLNQQAR